MNEPNYAVIDRAIIPGLVELAEQHNAKNWCLFPAPVEDEFARVAPYLVLLTPELSEHLSAQEKPWGFMFISDAGNKILIPHLRRLLSVYIDENDAPTFCRFYDPRVLWSMMDSLTPAQQYFLAGPMRVIQTEYPEQRQMSFDALSVMHQAPEHLTLNSEQYSYILAQSYQYLEDDISQFVYHHQAHNAKNEATAQVFAKQLLKQLSEWGISVASEVKSVARCCVDNRIDNLASLPQPWVTLLSNQCHPAAYRVKTLLKTSGGINGL